MDYTIDFLDFLKLFYLTFDNKKVTKGKRKAQKYTKNSLIIEKNTVIMIEK